MRAWRPQRPEEGIRCPGTGVPDGYELSRGSGNPFVGYWAWNPGLCAYKKHSHKRNLFNLEVAFG